MISVGQKIPDFSVKATVSLDIDKAFETVTNTTYKGKWLVLFAWPKDFTFVCPTELEDLADHYAEFEKLGVEIYAVSTDTHFSHKAWHDTSPAIGKIRYTMIGDPSGVVTNNFDVMRPASAWPTAAHSLSIPRASSK